MAPLAKTMSRNAGLNGGGGGGGERVERQQEHREHTRTMRTTTGVWCHQMEKCVVQTHRQDRNRNGLQDETYLSPAMLPKAHTACSRTSSDGERSKAAKMGTQPDSTTSLV